MKLYLHCAECVRDGPVPDLTTYPADVPDDNRVDLTCRHGHHSVVILYDDKHDLLFDSGASALHDGYPREAVASFAASVERFYEYATKIMATGCSVSEKELEGAWKGISSQSERQLGAFRFTYLIAFKQVAPVLPNKSVEFRNSVIHRGVFPSEPAATDYGETCLEHMKIITLRLRHQYANAIRLRGDAQSEAVNASAPEKPRMLSCGRALLNKRWRGLAGRSRFGNGFKINAVMRSFTSVGKPES